MFSSILIEFLFFSIQFVLEYVEFDSDLVKEKVKSQINSIIVTNYDDMKFLKQSKYGKIEGG